LNKDKANSLENTLNKLYENDTTLNYLKQYEEDRNKLLSSAWDNNISLESEKLKDSLSNSSLKNAFSSVEDYKKYSEPILNTINTHDYDTLHKLIAEPFNTNLKNDYAQALKATDIFSNSLDKVSDLGLAKSSYYDNKLNETIEQYETDKIKASKNLLDLAYSINNDSFESKINKNTGLGSLSKAFESIHTPTVGTASKILSKNKIGGALSDAFGSINTPVSKQVSGLGSLDSAFKAFESVQTPKVSTASEILSKNKIGGVLSDAFGSINTPVSKQISGLGSLDSVFSKNTELASVSKALESVYSPKISTVSEILSKDKIGLGNNTLEEKIKSLSSFESNVKPIGIDSISINPPKDFKPIEIPKIQDSAMYKQNEKLIDKTEKQTEAIEEMSKYLIDLGTKQEEQSNITNEQNIEFLDNSHKQIELMDKISGFLSSQSEILELQKKNQELQREELNQLNTELLTNSHEQIKLMSEVSSFLASQSKILEAQQENQELQNAHLKLQNEKIEEQVNELKEQKNKMDEQIEDNKKSSKIALGTAVASILIGAVVTYYVYIQEDKSDSINHKELKENLILQNQNINTMNKVLETGFINNTKINQELLKQLKIQNQNLLKINQQLKKGESNPNK